MCSGKLTAFALFLLASTLTAAPRLVLSTTVVGPLSVAVGANGATQTLEAFNAGDGNLNLTASASASWLSATIGASQPCTTRSGNCLPVNIALNTSSLAFGAHTESITLNDPNAVDTPQQIFVTVNIVGVPSSLSFYVTPASAGTSTSAGSEVASPIYPKSAVTAVVTTQTGGNWLALTDTAASGGSIVAAAPYYVEAAAQNSQTVGVYSGSIVIAGSSNPADNKTIAVTMTITNSPIIQLGAPTVRLVSDTGIGKAAATVQFANIGFGTLAITGATATSATGSFLSASVIASDTILITGDPTGLAAGIYSGTVTIASNAANNSQVSVPVAFTVNAATPPQISSGGIVNATTFAAESFAPGEILALFGDQLAPAGTQAVNTGLPPLATTLGGTQVLVNNVPAPLYFSSPGQLNFQVPYEVPPNSVATVQVVSNGKAGNVRSVNVVSTSPRMMVWGANVIPGGYGIIVNQDYSLTLPSSITVPGLATHPAKIGDTITIYSLGFGQTTPAAVTGAAASSTNLETVSSATATFGGLFSGTATTVAAAYAGLTPTAVGLYQVNVQIPPDAPIGPAVPVTLTVNGVIGNFASLAISQ
jgi:uncharacterized protein (TIGR03437 family)